MSEHWINTAARNAAAKDELKLLEQRILQTETGSSLYKDWYARGFADARERAADIVANARRHAPVEKAIRALQPTENGEKR